MRWVFGGKLLVFALGLLLLLSGQVAAAQQAYGELDASFGEAGRVTLDLGDSSDRVNSLLVQPDGKIVLSGISFQEESLRFRFNLVRYDADGALDGSFGDGGKVISSIGAPADLSANIFATALQPDGKILAAGVAFTPGGGDSMMAVARYNPDGSFDSGFGGASSGPGWVLTQVPGNPAEHDATIAQAIAVAPGGKIVVAGQTAGLLAVLRYNADGSLDDSFGDGGITTSDLGRYEAPTALQLQPDGKIVVAGTLGFSDVDFLLARYNPDGSLDTSFGQGGKVVTDALGGDDWLYGLALRPDGKMIAGGTVDLTYAGDCGDHCGSGLAIAQYNPDGSLDPDFGDGGRVVYGLASGEANRASAMVRRADGKLVLAGSQDNHRFLVAIFNEDGTPDAGFGSAGIALGSFAGRYASAYAVAVQPDGKIVAAGQATPDDEEVAVNWNYALARFQAPPIATAPDAGCPPKLAIAAFLPDHLWQYACAHHGANP